MNNCGTNFRNTEMDRTNENAKDPKRCQNQVEDDLCITKLSNQLILQRPFHGISSKFLVVYEKNIENGVKYQHENEKNRSKERF